MAKKIKKGQTFLCRETLVRDEEALFVRHQLYRSRADHSITAENGLNLYGFNQDVLDKYFVKV